MCVLRMRNCETDTRKGTAQAAPWPVHPRELEEGHTGTPRRHSCQPSPYSELAPLEVTPKQNPLPAGRRGGVVTGLELGLQEHSPVCEVGVRGVGAATSCAPRSRPEAVEGSPRVAGFRECLNRSSRSRRSRSASSAARLAP